MAKFNIGKDGSVTIVVNGAPLNPLTLTEFSSKQMSTTIESKPLNAPPQFRKQMQGWEGTLTYDRGSSALDQYFVAEEFNFWAGGDADQISIIQTVIDPVTRVPAQFRFDGVVLFYEDQGKFRAEERVSQQVNWRASTQSQVL